MHGTTCTTLPRCTWRWLFSAGFPGAFADADLLPQQERPGGGRGYLGCPVGKRLQHEPSPRQVPAVRTVGLGLPSAAEAKIRACGPATSASPSRSCSPEGLGLLLPPHRNWCHQLEGGLARPDCQQRSSQGIGQVQQMPAGQQHCFRRVCCFWRTAMLATAETPTATSPVPGWLCSAVAEEVRGRLRPFISSHVGGPPRGGGHPAPGCRGQWDMFCSQPAPPAWGGGCCYFSASPGWALPVLG